MKIRGTGRNLLVINKDGELFDSLEIKDSMLFIFAANKLIKQVQVSEIHACLYCAELGNITLIVNGNQIYKITMIMEQEASFQNFVDYLKTQCRQVEFSIQNKKIGGYTTAIVEKLLEGTVLTIIDKKVDEKIIYCPDCGVQCDPGIPYCMECGAMVG